LFDVALIGVGRVGFTAVKLLTGEMGYSVLAVDCVDKSNVLKGFSSVEFKKACNPLEALETIVRLKPSIVAASLPSRIAEGYIREFLMHGYNVVDVSFIDFNPYKYSDLCREKHVAYVVDAGFAPGFSNLIVGWFQNRFGKLDRVAIYVGGNPVDPKPPLYYEITWSAEDLIEEYTRPARIVKDCRIVEVDPLQEVFEVEIPGVGGFEAFYSDGLRTMLVNVNACEMFEATLRIPGHLKVIKLLRDLGFLDRKPVKLDGLDIEPRLLTARLFEERFKQSSRDRAILYVEVDSNGSRYGVVSTLDGEPGASSIAVYTALVFAKTINIVLERNLGDGVYPLEKLYGFYDDYVDFLKNHGVQINTIRG